MRRIDELTSEINEATLQLQSIKDQMSKQFKEIWKLQCNKDMGKEYDKERYDDLMYNHKLLQMKRRQLITHINYLNKDFIFLSVQKQLIIIRSIRDVFKKIVKHFLTSNIFVRNIQIQLLKLWKWIGRVKQTSSKEMIFIISW